jgi:hypothetical protein
VPQGELKSRIRESLLELPQFQEASIDVHLIGDDGFVVFGEDAHGMSVPLRTGLIRFIDEGGPTITWTEEHTLTNDQALIYQRALNHISKCVIEGQEKGLSRIPILDSETFPEIFEAFSPGKTLEETLKPDNAAVWWNVENSLELWGYTDTLGPAETPGSIVLWAESTKRIDPPSD